VSKKCIRNSILKYDEKVKDKVLPVPMCMDDMEAYTRHGVQIHALSPSRSYCFTPRKEQQYQQPEGHTGT
jgi:hypothetical protein